MLALRGFQLPLILPGWAPSLCLPLSLSLWVRLHQLLPPWPLKLHFYLLFLPLFPCPASLSVL